MTCRKCGSNELIFLFQEKRHTLAGEYQYTWEYTECCDCHQINVEQVRLSTQTTNSLAMRENVNKDE